MFIQRDLSAQLLHNPVWIQIVLGPRQCGKSTLLSLLKGNVKFTEITFDDLSLRQLAERDPALFLEQFTPPLLLDEVQYTPNLFPELKKRIDAIKKTLLKSKKTSAPMVLFRLTGSNQILMDKNIKESLAGRASYYYLNTLSIHEITQALPETSIQNIL